MESPSGRPSWLPAFVALLYSLALGFALLRFGGAEIHVLYLLFLLLAVPGLLAIVAHPLWRGSESMRPVLPIMGLVLLGQVALRPALTGKGWTHLAVGWLALFLTLWLIDRSTHLRRFLWLALIALGGIEALYGLIQAIGGVDYIGSYFRGRGAIATGTLINRNHFAFLLTAILALALGALYGFSQRRRGERGSKADLWAQSWIVLLCCSFMGVGVLLSQSRGGSTSLLATLLFVALLLALRSRMDRGRSGAAIAWVLLATIVGLSASIGIEALIERFGRVDENLERLVVYRDTLDLIGDHFWIGVGPGMYLWRFRSYQTSDGSRLFDHAHNDYLESAAEWGVPIAAVVWSGVLWVMVRTSRRFLDPGSAADRGLALGCAAAIFSVLLHSLIDFSLQLPALLMVFVTVLGLAWSLNPSFRSPRSAVPDQAPGAISTPYARVGDRVLRVLLATALLGAGWTVVRHLRADRAAQAEHGVEGLERAVEIDPTSARFRYLLGRAYRDLPGVGSPEAAVRELSAAVRLNKYSWRYRLEQSRALELVGELDDATAALSMAVRLNPVSGTYRWRLANLELRQGELDAAAEQIGSAVELDPGLQQAALAMLLKSGVDWVQIDRIWPSDRGSRIVLLGALSRSDGQAEGVALETLEAQWRKITGLDPPPTVPEARSYVSHLLARGEARLARDRWSEVNALNGDGDAAFERNENAIWNGDFERPLAGSPLGWQARDREGVLIRRVSRDETRGHALEVEFDGTVNLAFTGPRQTVVAEPGAPHLLIYSARWERLSTDQGPYLELVGSTDGAVLYRSPMLLQSSDWQSFREEVAIPAKGVGTVQLRLRRNESRQIDSRIRGRVWLDDFVLRRLTK